MRLVALPSSIPLVTLIILACALTAGVAMSAGDGGTASRTTGLDLPVGFQPRVPVSETETEDLGPTDLFGVPIASGTIHLCYSTYSSLNQTPDPMALQIRGEVVELIEAVPTGTSLSVTTYDCYTLTLPTAVMGETTRDAAVEFALVQDTMQIQHFGGAALQSIAHADALGTPGQRIIVITRGGADLQEFAEVTAANAQSWPIDVFYLLPESGPGSSAEWQSFAAENGGTFTVVMPLAP